MTEDEKQEIEKNETDNRFEIIVTQENGKITIEEKCLDSARVQKYIPARTPDALIKWSPKLRFQIRNLESSFQVGIKEAFWSGNNTESLYGEAFLKKMDRDTISFFGSDKEIKECQISISSTSKPEGELFSFRVDEESEEFNLSIFIHDLKYKKIKNSLEKGLIEEIHCDIELVNENNNSRAIPGLYYLAPFSTYKILRSIDDIKNKQDLPENFKDYGCNNSVKNYFSIFVKENLRMGKASEYDDDDLSNNRDIFSFISFIPKIEKALLGIANSSNRIVIMLIIIIIYFALIRSN